MSLPSNDRQPSKLWYVGHIFFGIVTGLICYILWKDENKKAAKRHLIASLIISILPLFLMIFVYMAIIASMPFMYM